MLAEWLENITLGKVLVVLVGIYLLMVKAQTAKPPSNNPTPTPSPTREESSNVTTTEQTTTTQTTTTTSSLGNWENNSQEAMQTDNRVQYTDPVEEQGNLNSTPEVEDADNRAEVR